MIIQIKRPPFSVSLKLFEGIGVGVNHDKRGLGVDETSGESCNVRTSGGHSNVWDELISGISEPHGFNVSSDDIGRLIAFGEVEVLDSGAHGVGKSFDKDVKELTILF